MWQIFSRNPNHPFSFSHPEFDFYDFGVIETPELIQVMNQHGARIFMTVNGASFPTQRYIQKMDNSSTPLHLWRMTEQPINQTNLSVWSVVNYELRKDNEPNMRIPFPNGVYSFLVYLKQNIVGRASRNDARVTMIMHDENGRSNNAAIISQHLIGTFQSHPEGPSKQALRNRIQQVTQRISQSKGQKLEHSLTERNYVMLGNSRL